VQYSMSDLSERSAVLRQQVESFLADIKTV
jgi:hypothetical protein